MSFRLKTLLFTCALAAAATAASAQEEKVLNLYSARHYATDEALYDGFAATVRRYLAIVDAVNPRP